MVLPVAQNNFQIISFIFGERNCVTEKQKQSIETENEKMKPEFVEKEKEREWDSGTQRHADTEEI